MARGAILMAVLMAGASRTTAADVKVGFLAYEDPAWEADWKSQGYYRVLNQAGLSAGYVSTRSFFRPGAKADAILARLQPFHVLLYERTVWDENLIGPHLKEFATALRRYVEGGGGLVLLADLGEYWTNRTDEAFNLMYDDWGLHLLREGIGDLQRGYEDQVNLSLRKTRYNRFFQTDNLTRHPITEGVRGLFLPQFGCGGMWGTVALEYGPDWTVIVRGSQTAASYAVPATDTSTKSPEFTQVGRYPSAPPVGAVRELGRGRVFVYAVNAMHVTINAGVPSWQYVHERRGDPATNRPSDGERLILNALRWAAEPALASPGLGGFQDQPIPAVEYPAEVEWDTAQFGQPVDAQGRGLIGLHTALSDGRGTVAEYAAEGRRLGLRFLVFNESLEQMTAAKWAQLKQDCAAASTPDLYCCPGLELTDGAGLRHAHWGEACRFPQPEMMAADGQSVKLWGAYTSKSGWTPNALLDYAKLRQIHGDPANLWWFFRLPVFVYDEGRLVADNRDEWRFAVADLRLLSPIVYTRVKAPAQLAQAAGLGGTRLFYSDSAGNAKSWCNTSFSRDAHAVYASTGPRIRLWRAINNQMESPWWMVRGAQRVRLRFDVADDAGVTEVIVHDRDRGPLRRFLAGGVTQFAREFELVHDEQHYPILEVVNTRGGRAISPMTLGNYVYCYKAGLFRCGDNLNMLGSAGILTHPDRHQFVAFKTFGDNATLTVRGIDTGSGAMTQPQGSDLFYVRTAERDQRVNEQKYYARPLRIPFSSYNLTELRADVDHYAGGWGDYSMGSLAWLADELPLVDWRHRAWLLQGRLNYFTFWNHRRLAEGSAPYQGDVIVHDHTMTFKKDVTLRGLMPVELMSIWTTYNAADGLWNRVRVVDADRGRIEQEVKPEDKIRLAGTLPPGGHLTAGPTDAGYLAFIAAPGGELRYGVYGDGSAGRLVLGYGREGQTFKAGESVRLRFLAVTVPHRVAGEPDLLERVAAAFNATGAADYPCRAEVGRFTGTDLFIEAEAADHEAVLALGAVPSIVDLPFRVAGLEDNGCAAVCVLNGQGVAAGFRFVTVDGGVGYFQQRCEEAPRLWVGNPLVADHAALRLTLVVDGQAPGRPPRVEVHNPTDQPITAAIRSPAHTPLLAGLTARVTIPAGDSRWYTVAERTLRPEA